MIFAAIGVFLLIIFFWLFDVFMEGRKRRFEEKELELNKKRFSNSTTDVDNLPDEL